MSAATALKEAATGRKTEAPKGFPALLESMRPQLMAALPKHISPDRMIRIALTCYRMTPKLRECTQESVLGAVVQCAQLGLEPGLLGQAYLVPFKKSWKEGTEWKSRMECQLIPGYRGLISLARRSGEVTSINAELVYTEDEFELTLGVEPKIVHKPKIEGDRGKLRLVYAVAKFKDGGYHLEWMSLGEVERIRARSKAKDDGPWKTDYEEMVKKTVVRRMSKYLPMSVELAAAVAVSNAGDEGKSLTLDHDFIPVGDDTGNGEQPRSLAEFTDDVTKAKNADERKTIVESAAFVLEDGELAQLKASVDELNSKDAK